jgi:head-tail adaptor
MGTELAGRLRQRLRFEQPKRMPDGSGGQGDAWTLVDEVWGELRPAGRGPLSVLVAEGRQTSRRWEILVREGLPLRLGMRVIWRGLDLRLTGIDRDPASGDRVRLLAEELGPEA